MKVVIVNGSPRSNWNTAMLLKEAEKGALEKGYDVEYIDLYSMKFLGCRSCLICKMKNMDDKYRCHFKDELSPVLDKLLAADKIILGSPIYFSQPTSAIRAVLERLTFPLLSYLDYQSIFEGKIDVDVLLTMNAPEEHYKQAYQRGMEEYFAPFKMLNGQVRIFPICDTLQAKNYALYDMDYQRGEYKKEVRKKEFPQNLAFAKKLGRGEI